MRLTLDHKINALAGFHFDVRGNCFDFVVQRLPGAHLSMLRGNHASAHAIAMAALVFEHTAQGQRSGLGRCPATDDGVLRIARMTALCMPRSIARRAAGQLGATLPATAIK